MYIFAEAREVNFQLYQLQGISWATCRKNIRTITAMALPHTSLSLQQCFRLTA